MRCLVTGGYGFIGSHVVVALREAGHSVQIVDYAKGSEHEVDICDTEALKHIFRELRPQIIFHIAAIADAREALMNPVRAINTNIAGTVSVFEAARHTHVERVILASTCWVAGAMGSGVLDESTPFQPTGAGHIYTTTKIASELLAHDFYALYGLPFTILRYGIPYGPQMWSGLVLRSFLDNIVAKRPLTIFGDGSASRRFVYVKDLAKAHILALQEIAINQTYNLEGMRPVSVRELAHVLMHHLGHLEIAFQEEPKRIGEFKHFHQIISSHKAQFELGWEPKIDLIEGVYDTIQWYHQCVAPIPNFQAASGDDA